MSMHIQVRRLSVGPRVLIQGLALSIAPGEVHTLMGDSGSGKSSLLAALCGTQAPAVHFEGEVRLGDTRVDGLPTRQRGIAILFQDDLLFPHMTVRENLLFGVPPGSRQQREAAVASALHALEMTAWAHADPATLSGGQRARVALMRALLAQPRAVLLDEPFSQLDAALRGRMRAFVFGLIRERQIPALLVTHDEQDIADPLCITRLKGGGQAGSINP